MPRYAAPISKVDGVARKIVLWTLGDPAIGGLPGKNVAVAGYDVSEPLARSLKYRLESAGADVSVVLTDENKEYNLLRDGDEKGFHAATRGIFDAAAGADITIYVDSRRFPSRFRNLPENGAETLGVFEEKFYGLFDRRNGRHLVITTYPTAGDARLSYMPLDEYANLVLDAGNMDYQALSKRQDKITDALSNAKKLLFIGRRANLTLSGTFAKGDGRFNGDQHANFPQAEFYAHDPLNVSGFYSSSVPVLDSTGVVERVYLEIKNGKITKIKTPKRNAVTAERLLGGKKVKQVSLGMLPLEKPVANDLLSLMRNGFMTIGLGGMKEQVYLTTDMREGVIRELIHPSTKAGREQERLLYEDGRFLI